MSRILVEHLVERQVAGKRLGRHIEHDERSRAFAIAKVTRAHLRSVAWERFGGPFDQGDLGSCTGNAMAGWLNCSPGSSGAPPLLTEDDAVRIYSEGSHLDRIPGAYPPEDTGSSGLAVCKAALKEGRIAEYRHAFSIESSISAMQRNPVITGVPWYEGFDSPDANGRVKIAGQVRGGHEFLVVSFALPSSGVYLDGIVGAWNSWGSSWGKSGQFFFTARTWAHLLEQRGDVTVPIPLVG